MFPQSMIGSNYPNQTSFTSSKKKATTPALIFFKSQKDSSSKIMSQNNSALINTNRSPLRASNAKNNSLISRSPLLNKSNISLSQNKSAIFNKHKNSQYHDTSMKDSVHFCENHENRNANYVNSIDQSNVEYYCEKCAILLASQGYKVQKISQSSLFQSRKSQVSRNILKNSMLSQKSSKQSFLSNSRSIYSSSNARKVQIQNFLLMTKGLLEQIQFKKDEIKQNLIKSQQFYGQQIQEVNQYFELVYKSLQLQKNKCYNYILNQRIQVEKPVRLINQTITELKDKIQGIIDDIEQNIETVYQTADQIYRPVIQQYQDNYQDISKKIGQIQIFQVQMRKLDFEGVPQSIFCISDILKDSIDVNYQADKQKKLNKQLNSLKQSLKESLPQLQPKKLFSKRGDTFQDSGVKNNTKFCFSFEAEALQAQLQHEKIIYQRDQ